MKIHQNFSSTRQRWLRKPISARRYQSWLLETGSLTARLQQKYADFYVRPVRVHDQKPVLEEAALLHVAAYAHVQVREVLLYGHDQPVVFAHSILPRKSLRGEWRRLGCLGNKPLGAVLFASPRVKRTPLSYKKLMANHALYQAAMPYIAAKPEYLWARRSIFSLNCASIMVIEVFLPGIMKT